MELRNNIPEFLQKLIALREAVAAASGEGGGIQDALVGALNTGRGLMKRRIFNNSLDAAGQPLGNYHGNKTKLTKAKYVQKRNDADEEKERKKIKRNFNSAIKANDRATYTEYEKIRLGQGRQIQHKDLQLSGSIAASIETLKRDGNRVVIAISNSENAKIAAYQEQQIANLREGLDPVRGKAVPAPIFHLNQEEFEQVRVQGNRLIAELIKSKMK